MSNITNNVLKVKSYLQKLTVEEIHVCNLNTQKYIQKLIINGNSEFKHAYSNILLESKIIFDESKIYKLVGVEIEIINTSVLLATLGYLLQLDSEIINEQKISAMIGYLLSADAELEFENIISASLSKRIGINLDIELRQAISAQLLKISLAKINDYQTTTIVDMSSSTIQDLSFIII